MHPSSRDYYYSKLTKWSVVLRFKRKPHWLSVNIWLVTRNLTNRSVVLYSFAEATGQSNLPIISWICMEIMFVICQQHGHFISFYRCHIKTAQFDHCVWKKNVSKALSCWWGVTNSQSELFYVNVLAIEVFVTSVLVPTHHSVITSLAPHL